MPLAIAPRQFQRRADLYQQLAQSLSAGITLIAALEMIERSGLPADELARFRDLLAVLREGGTFTDAVRSTGHWLPAFDIALIHAGEQSGRLPECFRLLSNDYAQRARLARQTLAALAYPVFLLHLAVFLFPFAQFFLSGNLGSYLAQTFGVLIPFYLVVLGIIFAFQARRSLAWHAFLERLLQPVPLLSAARRALALARLASSLEALLSAGVTIIEAWEIAALASGSPALCTAVEGWGESVRAGQTPAEAIRHSRVFPQVFADLYQTGEISGKLDESLRNLSRYYEEEGSRKLQLLAQWGPRLFYLLIVLFVAFKIVQFWLGYFQQIGDVLKTMP
jgi:type II secretory pathway component PulF